MGGETVIRNSSIESISTRFNAYSNSLPEKTASNALKSLAFGFTWGTMLSGGNVAIGCVAGVSATVSSLIYAVVTPLFVKIAESHEKDFRDKMTGGELVIRTCLSSIVAGGVIACMTPYRIDIVAKCIVNFVVCVVFPKNDCPVNHSRYFV